MAKQKSSASSGTRKKHARKAAPADAAPDGGGGGKPKGSKPKKGDPPRKKVYVPPARPAPVRADPLDDGARAARLPPALVVLLRGLGKKAAATKARALEDLQRDWLGPNADDAVLEDTVPVWVCQDLL
jgi:hypothetical protein